MSNTGRLRTYPVPGSIASAHIGKEATLDQLEAIVRHDTPAGEWARRVIVRENQRWLDKVTCNRNLPRGLLADGSEDEVVGLINQQGLVWRSGLRGYEARLDDDPTDLLLTEDEVGYVARSLDEGNEMVVLTSAAPLGWLTPIIGAAVDPAPIGELPAGSKVIAVVDELDRNAVLELLAVAPGPVVYRRNDGGWMEDGGWVTILRSLKPPPLVVIDADIQDQVASQVDEATAGQKFVATGKPSMRGAGFGYLDELEQQTGDAVLEFALLAAKTPKSVAYDVAGKMPGDLQRYWLFGRGAAKIRWGTPGAWRRCYRHLVKYMGPQRAPGACTNLSQHLGGPGVATHVGVKAKREIKKLIHS